LPRHGLPAVGLALASLLAPPARAAEDPPPAPAAEGEPSAERRPPEVDIEDAVVTAIRRESALLESPVSLTRIDFEEMQRDRLRRTLTDSLLDVPSVMVQKTAYGQASPFLRGFTGYQTVLLVDGIRLNNSTFRSGPNQYWSTVDLYSIDSVEVVRGPGSVLYGSDAVGGAVNALARRRKEFEPGTRAEFRTVLRASTAERSHAERLEVQGNVDDVGYFAGATSRLFGDLRAGGETDRQRSTGYRERAGDLRLDGRSGPTTTWALGVQHVRQVNVPRTEQTIDAIPFHGTAVGTELKRDLDQDRDLVYARWTIHDRTRPEADRAEVTLSFHRQAEEQDRDRTGGRTDVQAYEVRTLGLQAQAVKETRLGTLTGGVEWWRDSVSSERRDYLDGALTLEHVQGPVADRAGYDLAAVYLQDEVPLGGGVLIPAIRFTHAAARAGRLDNPTVAGNDPATPGNVVDLRDSWNNVVGSLRAVQPLGKEARLFGGVSQAFRAPNLSDLTRLDDTSGVETPSPGLDPEEFVTAEAGVRVQREGWTLQAAAWRTWIDGLIVPSPTGALIGGTPEVRKDNVGDGWAHGAEVESTVAVSPDLSLSGGATWMRGAVDQLTPAGVKTRRPLSRLMPFTAALTLSLRPPKAAWNAWVSGRAAEKQDRLSLKDETDTRRIPPGGTPGYGVLSVGAGYEIGAAARVAVAVENVLNKDYRIHGSGVNEPGRNLVVSVELEF
jgi:hemoglobin/transferrin/lactoferrin receptor protein